MKNRNVLPVIDPSEVRTITFDFTDDLGSETLTGTPILTVAVESGTDVAPNDILDGSPDRATPLVLQQIADCSDWVDYHISCQCATPTRTLVLTCTLPCRVK